MKEIDVVKTPRGLHGWTEEDERARQKMKRRIENLEPGEFCRIGFSVPRHGPFHRKFFKMISIAYEAWDPMASRSHRTYKGMPIEKNFDLFREEILILAGYGIPHFDVDGRVHWKAKSISYDEMEQEEFEKVYEAVATVLLSMPFMDKYNRAELDRVVDELMKFATGNSP